MLSIRVAVCHVILVGSVIKGNNINHHALMADGHAKISSAKTKINNRELAKTLADLVDDNRNNSMSDVESVEMDTNKKENTQRKAMATSNSSDNASILGNLQETDKDDKMKDLIITEKGKLKWRGDLTTLQQFLDKAFNIN